MTKQMGILSKRLCTSRCFSIAQTSLLRDSSTVTSRSAFDNELFLDSIDAVDKNFLGLSTEPFEKRVQDILSAPLEPKDVECKPDGILYLPEIKYRRLLIKAFGAGGWGIVPRGPHTMLQKTLSREYALFCLGKFVSQSRGEQDFYGDNLATAAEGVKSNALMRCCKDLGIASDLWDPEFVRRFKEEYCHSVYASHIISGQKKTIWKRKDRNLEYPYKI